MIFTSLDETEKYEASNFQDLLENILSEYEVKKDNLSTRIRNQITSLIATTKEVNSLDAKNKELALLKDSLSKLNKELIKLPKNVEKEQEELVKLLELEILLREKIVELKNSLQQIETFEATIDEIQKQIDDTNTSLLRDLKSAGFVIDDENDLKLLVDQSKFDKYFSNQKKNIGEEIQTLTETDDVSKFSELFPDYKHTFYNYVTTKEKIKTIKGKTKVYESQKQKYQQQKKEILELEKKIKTLEARVKTIEEENIIRLASASPRQE